MIPEKYTLPAENVIKLARQASKACHHSYIGSEHLLIGLLREQAGTAAAVLKEFGVDEKRTLELIDELIAMGGRIATADRPGYTPRAEGILEDAVLLAADTELELAGTEHILLAILKDTDCVASRLLHTMQVNHSAMYRRLLEIMGVSEERTREMMRVLSNQDDGEGDTSSLDQYSRDLTAMAREGRLDPVIGRETETERLLQILSRRTKNNPCLIGEPGVGKTAIVEGLAQKIVRAEVPAKLRGRRVVVLDMASMVAGTKFRGEFEERMKQVLQEVMDNRDILLFIDELHTIIGAGGAEGSLDASNIMKPFLSRGEVQVIGATTVEEYRKYIEKDPALERRFQPVMVEEPSEAEVVTILKGLRPAYEKHHGVTIDDKALEASVSLSARYINDRFLPDKAIDLMDESCARKQLGLHRPGSKAAQLEEEIRSASRQLEECLKEGRLQDGALAREELQNAQAALKKELKKHSRGSRHAIEVTPEDIAATVSMWTGIPASRIDVSEGKKLLNLDKRLHERVIGQEEAVTAVAKAIRRGRAGLKDPKRPIGSFLFLGPTGVGKTELSKALAQTVFGSEQNMIRVDMSEYMEKHSVSRLVGSPPGYVGYEEGGQLSEKVRRHPYSVILFDEIEKAHPDVFNILLQVLDEGHITDSQGRRVDFKNSILIMTSNAGAQSIITPKHLGFGAGDDEKQNYERMKSGVLEEIRRMFRPEFLNRIDDIIVFHSLNRDEISQITGLLLKELAARCKEQMDITLKVKSEVAAHISKEGFDEKYGARPLRRAIQNQVEDQLAEEILSGTVKAGDTVTATLKDGKVVFRAAGTKSKGTRTEKKPE